MAVTQHKLASLCFAQGLIAKASSLTAKAIAIFEAARDQDACESGLLIRSLLFRSVLLEKQVHTSASASSKDQLASEAEFLRRRGFDLIALSKGVQSDTPMDLESDLDLLVQPDFR